MAACSSGSSSRQGDSSELESLKKERDFLKGQVESLKKQLSGAGSAIGASPAGASKSCSDLEDKVLKLQEKNSDLEKKLDSLRAAQGSSSSSSSSSSSGSEASSSSTCKDDLEAMTKKFDRFMKQLELLCNAHAVQISTTKVNNYIAIWDKGEDEDFIYPGNVKDMTEATHKPEAGNPGGGAMNIKIMGKCSDGHLLFVAERADYSFTPWVDYQLIAEISAPLPQVLLDDLHAAALEESVDSKIARLEQQLAELRAST